MCGRFVEAGLMKHYPNFFDYLFIDECGSVTEAASLIPIAGVIADENGLGAHIIIAGDHQQLGPVIKNGFTQKMGHGRSLLERLMNDPAYLNSPHMVTKLVENYRSHSAILEFSNEKFYNGELLAKGPSINVDRFIDHNLLLNAKFPIIFKHVSGKMVQKGISRSYLNWKEIRSVTTYLKKLLKVEINGEKITEKSIGIISPYSMQVHTIKEMCKRNKWNDLEIGSSEEFQGREKPIIILSTVRTNKSTVGFLSNFRRMNVALTRAKALLIIVGDITNLSIDENWRHFIEYCRKNNAIAE
jgi:helicase MOV-10